MGRQLSSSNICVRRINFISVSMIFQLVSGWVWKALYILIHGWWVFSNFPDSFNCKLYKWWVNRKSTFQPLTPIQVFLEQPCGILCLLVSGLMIMRSKSYSMLNEQPNQRCNDIPLRQTIRIVKTKTAVLQVQLPYCFYFVKAPYVYENKNSLAWFL